MWDGVMIIIVVERERDVLERIIIVMCVRGDVFLQFGQIFG
jgi:hypothetical protein